jgi:hypothetical protein
MLPCRFFLLPGDPLLDLNDAVGVQGYAVDTVSHKKCRKLRVIAGSLSAIAHLGIVSVRRLNQAGHLANGAPVKKTPHRPAGLFEQLAPIRP